MIPTPCLKNTTPKKDLLSAKMGHFDVTTIRAGSTIYRVSVFSCIGFFQKGKMWHNDLKLYRSVVWVLATCLRQFYMTIKNSAEYTNAPNANM
jgi:hypothetical protein